MAQVQDLVRYALLETDKQRFEYEQEHGPVENKFAWCATRLKPVLDIMGFHLSESRIAYVLTALDEVATSQGTQDWATFYAFWFAHYGIKEKN